MGGSFDGFKVIGKNKLNAATNSTGLSSFVRYVLDFFEVIKMQYKHLKRSSQNLFKFLRVPSLIVLLIVLLTMVMAIVVYIASINDVDFKFILKLLDVFEVETHLTRG